MKNFEHLTLNQISSYAGGGLSEHDSDEIGRHLLKCADCRKLLPLPTVEQFWSAIMTEIDDKAENESDREISSIISGWSSIWKQNSGLIWSGAALVVLIGFSALIWLNFSGSHNSEVAHSFEINTDLSSGIPFPATKQDPVNPERILSEKPNRSVASPTPKTKRAELPKSQPAQTDVNRILESPKKRQQISETRGVSAKCNEGENVEIEFTSDKENFVFKWKKVPNAVKYHLYISDDDEILIDEYETEAETTFVLRKPLDPLKTYKWKIIVTLENGQTVAGPSNKFTVKDFQTNQKKPERKQNSNIRCSANS